MSKCKFLILFLSLLAFSLSAQDCCSQFNGTWQANGKPTFEKWIQLNDTLWTGEVYKIIEGKKALQETLRLFKTSEFILFEATVLNQNDARPIVFKQNPEVEKFLSFENIEHDFPKKIQYQFLSENEININVLGESDKGFSINAKKVE
jgi:hypothetical protein